MGKREIEENSEDAHGAPNDFRTCSANEEPIFAHAQPTSTQFLRMFSQRVTNFHTCSASVEITTHFKYHHSKYAVYMLNEFFITG
jgi:hypothetical protein